MMNVTANKFVSSLVFLRSGMMNVAARNFVSSLVFLSRAAGPEPILHTRFHACVFRWHVMLTSISDLYSMTLVLLVSTTCGCITLSYTVSRKLI